MELFLESACSLGSQHPELLAGLQSLQKDVFEATLGGSSSQESPAHCDLSDLPDCPSHPAPDLLGTCQLESVCTAGVGAEDGWSGAALWVLRL